ncbi:hypothetical protein LZ30DRAFT_717845 [Colletotrichum cereale]|nr:hypothetical protein LZ30DRAFT_717845 [Colletotrichum cereale]
MPSSADSFEPAPANARLHFQPRRVKSYYVPSGTALAAVRTSSSYRHVLGDSMSR